MAVPIINFTTKNIRDEVIGTGGSVPINSYTFSNLRAASSIDKYDSAYSKNATTISQVIEAGQLRNYPKITSFWNVEVSQNFTKNNCGTGGVGSSITYTIPANTYSSTISQADANSKAQAALTSGGQNYANSNGTCSYCSVSREVPITKNDCPSGYNGTSVMVNATTCQFTSSISQADANNQRDIWMQNDANTRGNCVESLFYSEYSSTGIQRNNCSDGGTGNIITVTANAGQFTSTVSIAHANSLRDAWMQSVANSNGSCYWCPDNRGHFVQRNNCPSGQEGSWVEVYYPGNLCDFSSTVNKQDAENKLTAWLLGSGSQSVANSNGTCTTCGTWLDNGAPYCSGNNLVQNQYKFCASSGQTETRTITIQENSPSCTNTTYYIFYTCDAALYPWNYYTTSNPGLAVGTQVYPNADSNQISYYVGTTTSIDSSYFNIGGFTVTGLMNCAVLCSFSLNVTREIEKVSGLNVNKYFLSVNCLQDLGSTGNLKVRYLFSYDNINYTMYSNKTIIPYGSFNDQLDTFHCQSGDSYNNTVYYKINFYDDNTDVLLTSQVRAVVRTC